MRPMPRALTTKLLLASALLGAGPAWAADSRFDYIVAKLPAGEGCLALAGDLANGFEQQTSIAPRRVACENAQGGTYDVRITYVADVRAPLVSTYTEAGPVISAGSFASRAACEASIESESARFERLTGLTPLVAYCYAEDDTTLDPWALRIDAFGTSPVFPSYSGTLLIAEPVGLSGEGLAAAVASSLAGFGFDVGFVKFRRDAGIGQLTAQVYGEVELLLSGDTVAPTATLAQCEQQLAELRGMVTREGSLLAGYCGERLSNFYEVNAITLGNRYLFETSRERFGSYADCRAQRDDIVDIYRDTADRVVLGGLCAYELADRDWRITLLTERPGIDGGR